jgi:hypothetical protein
MDMDGTILKGRRSPNLSVIPWDMAWAASQCGWPRLVRELLSGSASRSGAVTGMDALNFTGGEIE